jgi:hypothetical protein
MVRRSSIISAQLRSAQVGKSSGKSSGSTRLVTVRLKPLHTTQQPWIAALSLYSGLLMMSTVLLSRLGVVGEAVPT